MKLFLVLSLIFSFFALMTQLFGNTRTNEFIYIQTGKSIEVEGLAICVSLAVGFLMAAMVVGLFEGQ